MPPKSQFSTPTTRRSARNSTQDAITTPPTRSFHSAHGRITQQTQPTNANAGNIGNAHNSILESPPPPQNQENPTPRFPARQRPRKVLGEVDVESMPEYQGLVGSAFFIEEDPPQITSPLPMSALLSPRQYRESQLSKETTTILLSSAKKTPSSRRTSVGDPMEGLVDGLVDAPRERKSLLRRLKVSESPLGARKRRSSSLQKSAIKSTAKSASQSAKAPSIDVTSPTRGKSSVEPVDDLRK